MRPSSMDEGGKHEALMALLQKNATPPADDDVELRQNHAYISAMRDAGVFGPWSMDPEVLIRQADLYWFGYELCNGPFQRETFWTKMDERSVKNRERMLKDVRSNLEADVKKWLN